MIPALDEGDHLPLILEDLQHFELPFVTVVVDGGSRDLTAQAARDGGAAALHTERGRGRQMNAGAQFLDTPWLLFLHADSRISEPGIRAIEQHIRGGSRAAAHFRFAVDEPGVFYRALEIGQRVRERLFNLVYGDQGLLVSRALFADVGGFPSQPIMEDVIMTRSLQALGCLRALDAPLHTSPRRYLETGRWQCVARNSLNLLRFTLGAAPETLAPSYPARRTSESTGAKPPREGPKQTLMVFAKAPREGTVKTRLEADLGASVATSLYRQMARTVVSEVVLGPAATVVCFDPVDGESELRELFKRELPGQAPAFVYQGPGDLGERMSRMFERAFTDSDRAVVIGTDTPSVDRRTIERAFRALDSADLVIGPATDGGYYLLGLKSHAPELFADIEWSTPHVLAETVAKGERLGLGITYLELLSDVDTVEDLTPELRAMLDPGDL